MHRHVRPFAVAAGLLMLASAAWWMWPVAPQRRDSSADAERDRDLDPGPPASTAAPHAVAAPRVAKEQLAPAAAADAAPLQLPGRLPPLKAPIAPALADAEPPVESVEVRGQLHPSFGQVAASAAWPAVRGCVGDWQGDLQLSFGVAGGETVGDSRFWEPKVSGAPPQIQACIAAELAQSRTPAATDANGSVTVVYHVGGNSP